MGVWECGGMGVWGYGSVGTSPLPTFLLPHLHPPIPPHSHTFLTEGSLLC
jgi:hypothetical protein